MRSYKNVERGEWYEREVPYDERHPFREAARGNDAIKNSNK
jgi:hypothetical protein